MSDFLFWLRNFFFLISYINNADFCLFLLNHMLEEKENRPQECLNMSLGELLKNMCLLSGELNHPLDSLTVMTAMGASALTHMKKPTFTHQKCLHFLCESHSKTTKWTDSDIRDINSFFFFSIFLQIWVPVLCNDLMQFNCPLFDFQASFPKMLFPNCTVHSEW